MTLTTDTINPPDPVINQNIVNNGTYAAGPLAINSTRGFTVEGYVNTSHGLVDTKVVQSIDFNNGQRYYVLLDGSVDNQFVGQITNISSATTTTAGSNITTNNTQYSWPLGLNYAYTANSDGSWVQSTQITQEFSKNVLVELNGTPTYSSTFLDKVYPTDTLNVDASGNYTLSNQTNMETYQYSNSNGACWNETLKASAGQITLVQGGSCSSGRKTR